MRRLPLAALILAAAARWAWADPLADANRQAGDLKFKRKPGSSAGTLQLPKDLIGGPSPTLTSPGDAAGSDPKVKAFLAAVDVVAGDGLPQAKAAFGKYLERPGGAGGLEGPGDRDFAAARDLIRRLVLAPADAPRRIAVGRTTARAGGSAGWGLAPYARGDPFPGGDLDFADPPRAEIGRSGPGDLNYYRLVKLDDWANGVLHEALHVYYDAFVFGGFAAKATGDEPPICFGQTVFAMGAAPALVCGGGACPQPYRSYNDPVSKTAKPCYRPCADAIGHSCYSWATPGRDANGPTEIVARTASLDMTEASRGAALRKILDAVR